MLLLHITGVTRTDVYATPDRTLTPEQWTGYDRAIERRLRHEPIQYITCEQEFFGVPLHVTPAVLIPRPETEHLVESVLGEFAQQPSGALNIADIGTGSGAIAIVLAQHLPNASVIAVDVSREALEVARGNAERHAVSDRIQFLESDLLSGVSSQDFDAIVSNPPYVPERDRDSLHPQVSEYEPASALFAGNDGLGIYRRLIPQASATLKRGGLLAMEIGHGQREALTDLLLAWNEVKFVKDLQQIPRVVLARKR